MIPVAWIDYYVLSGDSAKVGECNHKNLSYTASLSEGEDFQRVAVTVSNSDRGYCKLTFGDTRQVEFVLIRNGRVVYDKTVTATDPTATTIGLRDHDPQTVVSVRTDLRPAQLHGTFTLRTTVFYPTPLALDPITKRL